MSEQRPSAPGDYAYRYPPSVMDWRFVVNSGQLIDLTRTPGLPASQQFGDGQPRCGTVIAPQMIQVSHAGLSVYCYRVRFSINFGTRCAT